jgi:hypothetical protein
MVDIWHETFFLSFNFEYSFIFVTRLIQINWNWRIFQKSGLMNLTDLVSLEGRWIESHLILNHLNFWWLRFEFSFWHNLWKFRIAFQRNSLFNVWSYFFDSSHRVYRHFDLVGSLDWSYLWHTILRLASCLKTMTSHRSIVDDIFGTCKSKGKC